MAINDINDIQSENIIKIDKILTKNIKRMGRNITQFITNIVVTGPAEVNERSAAQYICTAYYTDGTNRQVQADLWVENTIYATIDENGKLTTGDVPNADIPIIITASYKGFSNSQPVSIRNVVLLTHITITGPATVEERGGDQYICTAYYDNGNDASVTPIWSDSSIYGNIATDGYLTTLETPNQNEPCTISASYGGKTDNLAMTITNVVVLNSIEIEGPVEVNEDDTAQYNCRAYYDDGTSPLVTPVWSDNSPYASLNVNGLMTTGTVPQVDQSCSVTANFGGKVDSLAMTIKNVKVLTSLTIAGPAEVNESSFAEYTLTAHYADDPDELVNASSWSENSQYASINASGQLTTAAVPQGDQAIIITANYGGQSDTHNVTIKNVKVIDYLNITGSTSINERSTSQYTATLYYVDDPPEVITSTVNWSDDSTYGSINSSGLLTTIDVEAVTRACEIMALYPGSVARCVDQVYLFTLTTPDALIPVDPTKVYTGGAYLRANSIDSILNVNKCYVGLTYYDVNKAYLGTRWCFGSKVSFTSVGQIHHFYLASLTGEGATNAELWVGARYVSFKNLLNYQCTGNGTAIMEILFNTFAEAVTPNDNLIINPGFDQGGLNWQLDASTIESSSQGTIDTLDITINNTVDISYITITGADEVDERGGSQYTCTAYYDDGSNANVTSSTSWSENSAYATINSTGYLTTLETPNQDEPCIITANYGGKTDTHNITIKNVVLLDHITITGSTQVDENSTAQYTNTAYYDDSSTANVTNSTTWGENSIYATINSTGYLTTLEVPNADQGCQITANYGGKGDTQNITIKNVVKLLSVTVSGAATVNEESTSQYTCTAYYDDGSSANVTSSATWSDNSTYASISSSGLLTTYSVPDNTPVLITANYGGKSDDLGMTIIANLSIPAGLIVFHNDTSIPDGWTRYSAADNRMIIGAGSSFTANTSGQVSPNVSIGNGGEHQHGQDTYGQWLNGGSYTNGQNYYSSLGGIHSHIGSVDYKPTRNQVVLIKSNSAKSSLPANTIMPSTSPISGFTNIYTNGYYLSGGATLGVQAEVKNVTVGSAGAHNHTIDGSAHYNPSGALIGYSFITGLGSHSSTAPTLTVNENLKKVLLSLWTKASQSFDITSTMIAMWEGTTAPAGWKLCNGSNGTPNLRNCFIKPCVSGSENLTPSGDNTGDFTLSQVTHSNNHNHAQAFLKCDSTLFRSSASLTKNAWSHTHGGSTVYDESVVPPYYALSFIMKS